MEEIVLSSTTKFSKSLGVTGGITEVNKGQVAEKIVHAGVEFWTGTDDDDHAQIPLHSDCVDNEKHQEQRNLEVRIFWDQVGECGSSSLISFT